MLPGGVYSRRYESELAIVRTGTQWVLLALGIAFLFTIPLFANAYWLSWLTNVCIVIVAVGCGGVRRIIGPAVIPYDAPQ